MGYDFENYKNDAVSKPRNKAWSNWAKFEKVGEKVQGFIRDVFYREAEGEFKAARGITLEQSNGELINVAIKRLPFILRDTDSLRLGDPLTVVFEAQLAPKQKGYKGAKQMGFYGKNLEENAGNKTVAELDAEDMKSQGAKEDTFDKEAAEMSASATNGAPAAEPV